MTGTEIWSMITGAYSMVEKIGLGIIELFSKSKLDETEIAKQKIQYELALKNLDFSIQQGGMWLTEKLMVGAKWTYPLTMLSGCAIVAICLFNIVVRAMGWAVNVDIVSHEFLVLVGMFLFTASGSAELLIQFATFLMSKVKVNDGNKSKAGDNPPAKTKTGG
jgi:hypothetical protein